MMKKAIIDQMMLGIFLFFVLIAIGATVSDNTEARDKYYNLKKITDNAVLTIAKCYVNVEPDIDYCKEIYFDMLPQTKLGNEVKDKVYFDDIVVDLTSKYITITARIDKYIQETFWYKFIDLATFDLTISSTAVIESKNSTVNPSSTYSYGIAPFAINCNSTSESSVVDEITSDVNEVVEEVTPIIKAEDDSTTAGNCSGYNIGDSLSFTYELVTNWNYTDKNTMYPIIPNSITIPEEKNGEITYQEYGENCNSAYLLSDKFDKTDWETLNFDLVNYDWDDANCTETGADVFPTYADNIIPAMTSISPIDVNFQTDNLSSMVSLLGIYHGNENSTMMEQGGQIDGTFKNMNFPIEMDIVTLDNEGKPNGVVRLNIKSYEYKDKKLTFDTEVVGSEYKTVKLIN